LQDIILQGQRYENTRVITSESVEQFNQYAQEIKKYLLASTTNNNMILERLQKIQPIQYENVPMPFWMFVGCILFLPGFWIHNLIEYNRKKICQEKIHEIVSLFSSIEFLLKCEN
jgi:hypothetical protein